MLNEHGKLRLSPSKLMNWKNCPRLFKSAMEGQRTESIYAAIGNAAHHVLEQINKGVQLTPRERELLMEERLFIECKKAGIGVKFGKPFEKSVKTVMAYQTPPGYTFINAEAKRVLSFEKFDLVYIIDANFTNANDDKLIIRDYKTSAKVPDSPLQLLIYGVAETERLARAGVVLPDHSVIGEFHMLRDDKVFTYPMSNQLIHETREWLFQQVELILQLNQLDKSEDPKWKGKAFPEISGAGCHFCPRLECPNKISGY